MCSATKPAEVPTVVKLPYIIVPAPKDVNKSSAPETLVAVTALSVESFKNWMAPKEPVSLSLPDSILEPTELNSSALFRELAIIVYYITGGYYRACRFTYVENLLLIVLLFERMSIFSNSKAR